YSMMDKDKHPTSNTIQVLSPARKQSQSVPTPIHDTVYISAMNTKRTEPKNTVIDDKIGFAFAVVGIIIVVTLVALILLRRCRRHAAAKRDADSEKFQPDKTPDFMTVRKVPQSPRRSLLSVNHLLPNWSLHRRSSKAVPVAVKAESQQSGTLDGGLACNEVTLPKSPQAGQAKPVHDLHGSAIEAVSCVRKTSSLYDTANTDGSTSHTAPEPTASSLVRTGSSTPSKSPPAAPKSAPISERAIDPPKSNVHRVCHSFKPSRGGELALNVGDLARLLHEYDDGWAVASRLGHPGRGLVPRLCLSTEAVRPRGFRGRTRPELSEKPSTHRYKDRNYPQGPGQRQLTPSCRPILPQLMPPQVSSQIDPGSSAIPDPRLMNPEEYSRLVEPLPQQRAKAARRPCPQVSGL
ncbi:hypothetical protein QQS21_011836, partial [Conoideocrella luteorostrata]